MFGSIPRAIGLVAIGVVFGVCLDALALSPVRSAWPRQAARLRILTARQRDPAQFRKDSAAQAEIVNRLRTHRPPLEVRRTQAATNCAVSFEFQDGEYHQAKLFEVSAWDRLAPGIVVTRAFTYRETGFNKGDTATVVLPNVYCRDIIVASMGTAPVFPNLYSWAQ